MGADVTGEVISQVASTIVTLVYANQEKKAQEKFEREISELDAEAQRELLKKVTESKTEIERQNIVAKTLFDANVEKLKKTKDKLKYTGIGVAIIMFLGLTFLIIRKKIKK
jgi:hypothetical protein